MQETVFDYTVQTIQGESLALESLRGKVLLIVNTASKCGFTDQYSGLEGLYQQYKDKGLEVLGFPCNQFGAQEPGSNEEVHSFCQLNYGVSFRMFAKVKVNGNEREPLFKFLQDKAPGVMGSKIIKWNFTKFLVEKDGKTIHRFASRSQPDSLKTEIEKVLAS